MKRRAACKRRCFFRTGLNRSSGPSLRRRAGRGGRCENTRRRHRGKPSLLARCLHASMAGEFNWTRAMNPLAGNAMRGGGNILPGAPAVLFPRLRRNFADRHPSVLDVGALGLFRKTRPPPILTRAAMCRSRCASVRWHPRVRRRIKLARRASPSRPARDARPMRQRSRTGGQTARRILPARWGRIKRACSRCLGQSWLSRANAPNCS